jgi:predicted TIM-barrel fold metal-dependent hydrolase
MNQTSASAPMQAIGAIDTHAHVFKHNLPLAAVRRYAPEYDVTVEEYLARLDAHGISHGVLVQPSFLGSDNSYLIHALQAQPRRLRGIAMVDANVSSEQLQQLGEAGVTGVRFNLVGGADVPDFSAPSWRRVLLHLVREKWLVEIHREARDLPAILPALLDAGVNIVIDHFGRPDPELGVNDPGFRYLLGIAHTQRVWVKLSAAYRNGGVDTGNRIAATAMSLLHDTFGLQRLLWGSDWPHTQHERMTSYAQEYRQLCSLIPGIADRQQVLTAAAGDLYQFNSSTD